MLNGELRCNSCRKNLPVLHFHKCSSITRGYQYKCKSCVSFYDKNPSKERRLKKISLVRQWEKLNPEKRIAYKKQYYEKNKEHIKQKSRDWYQSNKDNYHERAIYRKYGVTKEQYNDLIVSQDLKCAICGDGTQKKKMFIDHNHRTGVIRGLLCTRCNVGLGMFKDNPEVLSKAIKYLKDSDG